jgi:hypothetical protein
MQLKLIVAIAWGTKGAQDIPTSFMLSYVEWIF